MQARSKLKPGQKGTRKLVELYGSRLVCARYRYDEQLQKRFKTVELIVAETSWTPKPAKLKDFKPEEIVGLKIAYGEVELGRNVKAAGGNMKLTQIRIRILSAMLVTLFTTIQSFLLGMDLVMNTSAIYLPALLASVVSGLAVLMLLATMMP